MTALLDTSVIVRYLMRSPPGPATVSRGIIEQERDLAVTDAALAEAAFVLASVYGVPRDRVIDQLVGFLALGQIGTFRLDKALVIQGLLMCRDSGRVSIPDALIWAAARSGGGLTVYTFDRRFPSEGIEVLPPRSGHP